MVKPNLGCSTIFRLIRETGTFSRGPDSFGQREPSRKSHDCPNWNIIPLEWSIVEGKDRCELETGQDRQWNEDHNKVGNFGARIEGKMDNLLEMGLAEVAAASLAHNTPPWLRFSSARDSFQWGGTISALFLLILNRKGRRSSMQNTLLVLYLFMSFPTVLFKVLRGEFGYWVAFLAVAANLLFPHKFPVSRFILFVITPEWLANVLRNSMVGGIFCLVTGVLIVLAEICEIGGFRNCRCNLHCFGYYLSTAFLLFFTILYLCLGTW